MDAPPPRDRTGAARPAGERLFVALPLGALGEEILAVARRSLDAVKGLRFPRAEGLHLTLLFLDRLPAERVPALAEALGRHLAGARAPRLRLDHAGAFPRPEAARVLWLGVGEEGAEGELLADLHSRVVAAVGETEPVLPALELERGRPWRPHVTVARPRAGALRTPAGFLGLDPDTVWEPTEAALLASVPAPEGGPPHYLPRARFPLAGDSGD